MDTTDELDALATAARGLAGSWGTVSDEQLRADGAAWEALGRVVDARRAGFTAEVVARSKLRAGEVGLAFRHGQRDGEHLAAHVARVSVGTARRWATIGAHLASKVSLQGEVLPGKYPVLAAAVADGQIGLDSARWSAAALHYGRKAEPARLAQAEADLVAYAQVEDTETVRSEAVRVGDELNQDGPEPKDTRAQQKRSFKFGPVDEDGGRRYGGYAPIEDAALIEAALAAVRKTVVMERVDPGQEGNEQFTGHWRETDGQHRRSDQVDYDTIRSIFAAGVRASVANPGASMLKSGPEVIVTTTIADLTDPDTGTGTIGGITVPARTVERLACGGQVRLLVQGEAGEPLWLGKATRLFTPAQRKALIARYSGCAWPGCTAPAAWCDAHHVEWWQRDDGPTDVDNGVLLCGFHHQYVHATTCRWRVVIDDGEPYLVPTAWRGEKGLRHRMQQRTRRYPRRDPDPWRRPLRI